MTIHQPNTELLLMFDTVYALARPGICVYSGRPQDLRSHLSHCNITCTESEFPIEVMLRVLSSDDTNKHLESLRKKTNESQNHLTDNISHQTDLTSKPILLLPKRFMIIDFFILLKRMAYCSYLYNWKSLLAQFFLYQITAFFAMLIFGNDKVNSNGCLDIETLTNETCLLTATDWKEQSNISQTINYNFSVLNFAMFFQLVVTTLTYSSDVQLFIKEHRNGISITFNRIFINIFKYN